MKRKIKDAISILYRVQGGRGDKRSKKYIDIIDGEICTDKLKEHSILYIGDNQHMLHFLKKRLGLKGDITEYLYLQQNMDLQLFTEQDVEVIRMYVPEWYKYVLLATAVEQQTPRMSLPKLVDKGTPGDSFGITRMVGKIITGFLLLWRKNRN